MLRLVLRMFQSEEPFPADLQSIFAQNNLFKSIKFPQVEVDQS
jgi:hypothetical protein